MTESLMHLDVLPARASVDIEISATAVRFRAREKTGLAVDGRPLERTSKWSGWFDLSGCPIELTWSAFDFEP